MESHANLSTVVVVPATHNLRAARFGGSFVVSASEENGLDFDSTLLVHQVRALDKRRIRDIVGHLSSDDMERLESSLRQLLSL